MGVHSGRFALVNGQSTTRGWSINDSHTPAEAVASNTAFGKTRRPGVREWTGSVDFFGNVPIVLPGYSFAFSGYTAPENDAFGLGMRYDGVALVTQLQINWNWTGGELINAKVDFAGHLALTASQQSPPLDASTPVLEQIPLSAGIQYAPGTLYNVFQVIPNVASATLTITNAVQEYVNSSTVVSGFLWKGRKMGIIDWSLSINQQDNVRNLFQIGDQIALKLFIDQTTFWLMKYGLVKDFTGIQVNRETGAIIAQTIAIDMDGVSAVDGSLGTITTPGNSVYWPITQS